MSFSLVSFFFSLFSSRFLRICRSCWRWCASLSSTRPTCWTWWTTRSWLSPRRRVVIWSTRPSATTCSPTPDRRCRRPGLDRGSLPVSKALNQLNHAATLTQEPWIRTALITNWAGTDLLRTMRWSPPNLKFQNWRSSMAKSPLHTSCFLTAYLPRSLLSKKLVSHSMPNRRRCPENPPLCLFTSLKAKDHSWKLKSALQIAFGC